MELTETDLPTELTLGPTLRVKVIGLGGGGSNMLNAIDRKAYPQVEYCVVNSDAQALQQSAVDNKILVGKQVTRGLGAGGDPVIGLQAVEADRVALKALVEDADLIILVAGLGGGTGTVAMEILAELAASSEALVVAFATLPFTFEGGRRREVAQAGLDKVRQLVHGLIPVPNDFLLQETDESDTALSAFAVADTWIGRGIHSLNAMLFETGIINQDFSAMRNLMQARGGKTIFATGVGEGENYIEDALEDLFACPLLSVSDGPSRLDKILVNLVASSDLGLAKMQSLVSKISEKFQSNEEIILGAVVDSSKSQSLEICFLAKVELESVVPSKKSDAVNAAREPLNMSEALGLESPPDETAKPRAVHISKLRKKKPPEVDQDEFNLLDLDAQRGYFEQSNANIYNNEDLDVPTYLRKGIKIKLKV